MVGRHLIAVASIALLSTVAHAAWDGGDCYDSTFDPQGQCIGFPVQTRLCEASQKSADTNTQTFGMFVVDQLRQKEQCSDYWTPHCIEAGGTMALPDNSCIYNCGLLQKASIQCSGPGTCEAATPIPNPIPTLKDITDLAMSLTCCDWVKSALMAVCDTYDPAKLDAYSTKLQTTQVAFTGSGTIPYMCTNGGTCISPSIVREKCDNAILCSAASSTSTSAFLITATTLLALAASLLVA